MLSLDLPQPQGRPVEILCIGAHADDIEIGCGATMLEITGRLPQRAAVTWVVLSSPGARRAEVEDGARRFTGEHGVRAELPDFQDGYFPYCGSEIKDFFEHLRTQVEPDVIFTHFRDDRHQDHRVVSDLTWNTFRDHVILEYEIPKWDGDLGHPNVYVPVAAASCQKKCQALTAAFPSQRSKDWFTATTFEGLMRLRGVECRAPSGFAEAFYLRKAVLGWPP